MFFFIINMFRCLLTRKWRACEAEVGLADNNSVPLEVHCVVLDDQRETTGSSRETGQGVSDDQKSRNWCDNYWRDTLDFFQSFPKHPFIFKKEVKTSNKNIISCNFFCFL